MLSFGCRTTHPSFRKQQKMTAAHTHDHLTLDEVAASCRERGLRFTDIRRQVMGILLNSEKPLGAYAILEQMTGDGSPAQPPKVYRALDFLVGNGFAHKIATQSTFTACAHPGQPHTPTFLICKSCDSVTEAEIPSSPIQEAAKATGFKVEGAVLEAEGICPDCA